MAIEKADFYSIFQEEGHPFYNDLHSINQDHFNEWIANKFQLLKTINSFEEVAPSPEIIDTFIGIGYKHRSSQCHYSAKAINLLNPEYEYWTGFVHRQDYYYPIITHSFNMKDGRIIDFARINDELDILNVDYPYFHHTYFGIKIPSDIIKNNEAETLHEYSMKPLLFEFFIEENE